MKDETIIRNEEIILNRNTNELLNNICKKSGHNSSIVISTLLEKVIDDEYRKFMLENDNKKTEHRINNNSNIKIS